LSDPPTVPKVKFAEDPNLQSSPSRYMPLGSSAVFDRCISILLTEIRYWRYSFKSIILAKVFKRLVSH
jgi:hypothetical protein